LFRHKPIPPLFQTPKEYPGTPGLGHGAVISADFNGDGFPDLAMVDVAAGAVRLLTSMVIVTST
jgi:FG-GAP repeat